MKNDYGFISEYYSQIVDGSITTSQFIIKLYKRVMKDLEEKKYFYDDKKAKLCVNFIENFCHHTKGSSDYFILELWQKALVSCIFGLVDKNKLRIYREIFVVIARKNGKSLLASAIVACATYIDGEYGAEVYCIAPRLKQAKIVYEDFFKSVSQEKDLADMTFKRRDCIEVPSLNTSISMLAFDGETADGFNPHLSVHDEVAAWKGVKGLKQYEVMKSALGARNQPIILNISTSGYVDNGIYDELMKRATAFLNGSSDESRLLPFLYIIDDIDKWDDIEELKKSNPNMNVSVKQDFYVEEIKIAKRSASKKSEFLTKYCNIKQSNSYAWLDYELVNRSCIEKRIEDFKGCYALCGIDLSQTVDLTAVSIVIEKDKKLYSFTKFFMPTNKLSEAIERDNMPYNIYIEQGILQLSGENFVNYKDIVEYLEYLRNDLEIYMLKVGYDRYSAQYLIDDLQNLGYQCDDVKQGENLSPVLDEFEGILKDGNYYMCDNNLLKAHFLNVAVQENSRTRQKAPIKVRKEDRIDGFVSVICAITVRQKWSKEIGEMLKNED